MNPNKKSFIFHIDFDSYFVSAVRTIKPYLKNKSVAIARSSYKSLAVSVSYELKAKGAKAGMTRGDILKIEPNTIFVSEDFSLYTNLSRKIFAYLQEKISHKILIASVDECYLDVNHLVNDEKKALNLAKYTQRKILEVFDIPITIGISTTKWYAKMTTNLNKPFGIGLTNKMNLINILNLPIIDFYGIGKSLAEKLKTLNIYYIKDLYARNIEDLSLVEVFGTTAYKYLDALKFDKYEEIIPEIKKSKVIGHESSFENINIPQEEVLQRLKEIVALVSNRLRYSSLVSNTINVKARIQSKKWINKNKKIPQYCQEFKCFWKYAYEIYQKNYENKKLNSIGFSVSNLKSEYDLEINLNLFEKPIENSKAIEIANQINSIIKLNKVTTLGRYKKELENKKEKEKIESTFNSFLGK